MLMAAKARATDAEIPFDLTIDDIVIPLYCPALGIKLFIGERGSRENSPSLDRIDPKLGYVKGNVIVISWRANRIKSNASYDEILKIGSWLEKMSNLK